MCSTRPRGRSRRRSSSTSCSTSSHSGSRTSRRHSTGARTTARSSAGIPAGGLFTGAEGLKTAEQAAIWRHGGEQYDRATTRAATTSSTTPTARWTRTPTPRRTLITLAQMKIPDRPASRAGSERARSRARAKDHLPPFDVLDMPTVLITGCSTGIGRATAQRLAAGDWTVYATARRVETLAGLDRCQHLALDVTDEASMVAAVSGLEIDVLINNAGYSQSGALETLSMESVRRQFETNVFGALRMCQLVLPGMRARGRGQDRQRLLDGRAVDLPGRRRLPRHQVRGRGDERRAADGGARSSAST